MDRTSTGPLWLADQQIAAMVVDTLHYGERELNQCRLDAYVVMPNHIHLLILPFAEVPRITRRIKGWSALQANGMLGRKGKAFWHAESFDYWPRNDFARRQIIGYIEENPVKAGLVLQPSDWRWSSAWGPIQT